MPPALAESSPLNDSQEENLHSTPGWTEARPAARTTSPRPWAALILLGCLALLAIAVYLDPRGRMHGTHADLPGIGGPCGMLVMTGYPCPTCGMTTAFAYTVRGRWLQASRAQPAGFVLALGTAALAIAMVWTLIRGRWPPIYLWRITPYRFFLGLLVLLLGSWAFKIVVGLSDGTLPYR